MHLLPLFSLLSTTLATSLTISLPSTPHLTNPSLLPPSTHATLHSHGLPLTAPLSRLNTFTFGSVPAGSHLLTVFSRDVYFESLRIDVSESGQVKSWTTWRGNEWGNKGEGRGEGSGDVVVQVRAVGGKEYFYERAVFSASSIFKNPMILIAIVTLGMVLGIPYIMDNLDPDMKAEFEEIQKSNRGMTSGASNLQNMDLAGDFASWMSGSKSAKKEEPVAASAGKGSSSRDKVRG